MKRKHVPIVVGNWKMNPSTVSSAKELFLGIRKGLGRNRHKVETIIAPPFPFISEMERLSPSKRIGLAAQDVFFEPSGAFTGEVSISMLKSVGVSHIIIGHSERRKLGETDKEIYADTLATIKSGMTAIVCVGEKKRDSNGDYFNVVEKQIHSAIKDVPKSKIKHLIVAYEPIWAIGTGKTATPDDILEMKLFIQKVLADNLGRKAIGSIDILYGGSVNKKNAEEILKISDVSGFLVGGASLRAAEFVEIIKIASAYERV